MKTMNVVLRILAAVAAVAGTIYIVATYGEKIVAWAKKVWANMPCPCCEKEEAPAAPAEEAPAAEEAPPAEEVPVEEPVAEEVVVEEPVADEADFAE